MEVADWWSSALNLRLHPQIYFDVPDFPLSKESGSWGASAKESPTNRDPFLAPLG
jgi:hypothetical protein